MWFHHAAAIDQASSAALSFDARCEGVVLRMCEIVRSRQLVQEGLQSGKHFITRRKVTLIGTL